MVRTAVIVDDSISMRRMVSATLQAAGFHVLEAESGQEGLDQLNGKSVSLIIADLTMPGMDGLTLIRKIRGQPKYETTPLLMLTTESQEAKKFAAKAAGATGWITKPFDPAAILRVIAKVIPEGEEPR